MARRMKIDDDSQTDANVQHQQVPLTTVKKKLRIFYK